MDALFATGLRGASLSRPRTYLDGSRFADFLALVARGADSFADWTGQHGSDPRLDVARTRITGDIPAGDELPGTDGISRWRSRMELVRSYVRERGITSSLGSCIESLLYQTNLPLAEQVGLLGIIEGIVASDLSDALIPIVYAAGNRDASDDEARLALSSRVSCLFFSKVNDRECLHRLAAHLLSSVTVRRPTEQRTESLSSLFRIAEGRFGRSEAMKIFDGVELGSLLETDWGFEVAAQVFGIDLAELRRDIGSPFPWAARWLQRDD